MVRRVSDEDLARMIQQHRLLDLRQRAWDDLYVFAREVLGYKDMAPAPHREMCDFLMQRLPWQNTELHKKLLLMPRGHFKSSVGTIAFAMWRLWRNPNLRILIDSELMANATKFLGEIKLKAETETFLQVCGPWRDDVGWKEEEIRILPRTSTEKEANIECGGIDTPRVGRHYDMIILDDPHSERNVTTRDQIDKVIQHWKLLDAILEPDGELLIIGTRWDYADLSSEILDPNKGHDAVYDIMVRKAHGEDGEPIFPSRFTHKVLEERRRTMGPYLYSCQYENEPVRKEDQEFLTENIPRWERLPEGMLYFLQVDPANAQRKRSDFTAMLVHGVSREGGWYLVDGLRDKLNPRQRIESAMELAEKWRVANIVWEAVGFQQTDKFWFVEESKRRGKFYPIAEAKQPTLSKGDRIRRLQPRYEMGGILWPARGIRRRRVYDGEEYELCSLLEDEMTMFPRAPHDDLLDCQASFDDFDWQRVMHRRVGDLRDPKDVQGMLDEERGRRARMSRQRGGVRGEEMAWT